MLNRDMVSFPSGSQASGQVYTGAERKILDMLEVEENRHLSPRVLYQQAGISESSWYRALKNPRFAALLTTMGVKLRVQGESHTQVSLATDPEEELAKDIWDIRRLKANYPKHRDPNDFKVDFTWIVTLVLRQQVKHYVRLRLIKWAPSTFKSTLRPLKNFLIYFPPETHVGTLDRRMVEGLLPNITHLSDYAISKCLQDVKAMLTYMATSPVWTEARPARFLIWDEDIPARPETLPRPIPPDVIDQLDTLLEQAVEATKQNQAPAVLSSMLWDAILILRHTGMRAEDLSHLRAPDEQGRNSCLGQDSEGYWWIRLHHSMSKMHQDHRIPTRMSEGVIEAIRRQQARIKNIPNHFDERYLFRHERGVLTYDAIKKALQKLASHLTYEDHPYRIAPHQFRHSIATNMIEQGVDIPTGYATSVLNRTVPQ